MAIALLAESVGSALAPSIPRDVEGRVPPDSSRWLNSHEKPRMLEWMTAEEWTRRWPDEHIAVMDPEHDKSGWIGAGWVFFHHPDGEIIHHEIMRLRPKHGTCPYTGEIPKDMVFIL